MTKQSIRLRFTAEDGKQMGKARLYESGLEVRDAWIPDGTELIIDITNGLFTIEEETHE